VDSEGEHETEQLTSIMGQIGRIFLTWRRHRQQGLLPFGATLKHYHVLRQLERNRSLSPSDIARRLFSDRPTATVIITTMERKGWVTRSRDPKDGKRVVVSITPRGLEKLAEIRDSGYPVPPINPLLALDPAERAELRRVLGKILRAMASMIRV
jgi:DNA-binding MarR family transcriptional regulator